MASKSKLARAGTMQATMKDAVTYLYPKKGARKRGYHFGEGSQTVQDMRAMGVNVPDTSTGVVEDGPLAAKGKKGAGKGGKSALKRDGTMARTVAEANRLLGKKVTIDEGKKTRSTRKKAAPAPKKPALKRAGTMQNTAKEGKNFLKRTKGKKGKGKK